MTKLHRIIGLAGALIMAVASGIIFLFSTFQTQANSEKGSASVEKRLDRIEIKIDQVYENLNGRNR